MKNPIGAVSCHLSFTEIEQAFVLAAAYDLTQIEWFESTEPRYSLPEIAVGIRRLSAQRGVRIGFHAPYLGAWSLAQPDPKQGDRAARDMIDRAARLGASLVTVHLGTTPPGMERCAALDAACRALSTAVRRAADHGIRIAVENFTRSHSPLDLGDTVEEIARALDVVPPANGGWTLDTGHAAISGNLDELLSRFGHRLVNTHLHDSDGRTDGHLPPGDGAIDWDVLFSKLVESGYAGPMTLEFPERSGRYPEFISRIRRAGPAPAVAADSESRAP
ncbi:MAG: sugar phosphate isomerase/epimerase [Kiritimatiellaeota bacterium]|nr:sugar phosphate isomerase/epimerase [Kiritimatiellota bacterium]